MAGLAAGNLLARMTTGKEAGEGTEFLKKIKKDCDLMLDEMEQKLETLKKKAMDGGDQPVDLRFTV